MFLKYLENMICVYIDMVNVVLDIKRLKYMLEKILL